MGQKKKDDERGHGEPGPEAGSALPPERIALPSYAQVVRGLGVGVHQYLKLLPRALESPAMVRVVPRGADAAALVSAARVRVSREPGFAHIDVEAGDIVLAEGYYVGGSPVDLYLDLLHELTHLRQLAEGFDLWDENFSYPNRPTEIEAYAVAVEEGLRLGMTGAEIMVHLSNPWMSAADVQSLHSNVLCFLGIGSSPGASS